ncbi:MAG: glycosyltransferase [Aggregatilineales bacterium]
MTAEDHMKKPLVTVITPTYNRADLLAETIDSVLSQDYANIEYLVLDDGSKDDTVELLKTYDDPRLKWESHANMGEANTVNKAFEMARGEFVIVVNSDDPILPGLLSESVTYLLAHPDVWVTYPDWVMIDDQSKSIKTMTVYEYPYENMLRYHHCPPGPGAMFRRDALDAGIRRDGHWRYVSDYEFWLKVGLHGRLARLPKSLATWRSHAGGASTAFANTSMADEHVNVVKAYFERPDVPAKVQQVKREAICNAYYIAAIICLPKERHAARVNFLRSIFTMPFAPIKYPMFQRNWRMMLRIMLLPRWLETQLRRFKKILKRQTA